MNINELITLAEREAYRLEQENDHGACIIMRACIEEMREARDRARVVATVPTVFLAKENPDLVKLVTNIAASAINNPRRP